ncbi:MAG: transposase, partial [Planctomycetaceae bacterium]
MAYQLMPNHWHLVLQPTEDGGMSNFLRWVALTHTMRLHAHRGTGGQGHVYQGRFKSFPIQDDDHFLVVCRYVERNALRADLVRRAEDWRWGSLNRWLHKPEREPHLLSPWPLARPPRWVERVNQPLTGAELSAVRTSVNRGTPFGDDTWVQHIARQLNLQSTLRPRGRPKKESCHLFSPRPGCSSCRCGLRHPRGSGDRLQDDPQAAVMGCRSHVRIHNDR